MLHMPDKDYKTIEANGLRFAYLELGKGQLVLCLHGFPDGPHTFDRLLVSLASTGFHAVAPATRGIYPTSVPKDENYSPVQLRRDVLALIDAFCEKSAAIV